MESGTVVGIVFLLILWLIAGLVLWGAIATGNYFFAQGDRYAESSPGASLGFKAGGVLIPLLFIAPISLAFFIAGLGAVGAGVGYTSA